MRNGRSIRVLMLGWEYPPHISGGLGTACEGLTTALAPLSIDIDFVIPHLYGAERAPHMRLLDADEALTAAAQAPALPPEQALDPLANHGSAGKLEILGIPALLSPYLSRAEYEQWVQELETRGGRVPEEYFAGLDALPPPCESTLPELRCNPRDPHYGHDLIHEVARYAARVTRAVRDKRPDIVHAHDWMTFPAATQLAREHHIPLVVHVHSLEQDRSGGQPDPTIFAIEGAGVRAATRVIAVSHYTARMIHEAHGVPLERIEVVHNGVYARRTVRAYQENQPSPGPVVLFLGRITYQKGPDYFVEAAVKVLEKIPNARFVMAGSGDMLPQMRARVEELGVASHFEFPGFVRGDDVERLFSTADVYVMPSVSEPFGIAALEAMSYETPVIMSRQSGAAEVLRHALKVDFWDVQKLASQIVAVLRYPELRRSIVEMAREEVRRVHWEASAGKVKSVYERLLAEG